MEASLEGADTCPHCRGLTVIEASARLRWRCAACGGARVPGIGCAELGEHAVTALGRARRDDAIATGANVATGVAALCALAALGVAAIAAGYHAPMTAIAVAAIGAVAGVAGALLRRAARRARASSRDALDEAWVDAAARIAKKRATAIAARDLAGTMRIGEADAELLLAKLSVAGARVAIDDDAEARYRVDSIAFDEATGKGGETRRAP